MTRTVVARRMHKARQRSARSARRVGLPIDLLLIGKSPDLRIQPRTCLTLSQKRCLCTACGRAANSRRQCHASIGRIFTRSSIALLRIKLSCLLFACHGGQKVCGHVSQPRPFRVALRAIFDDGGCRNHRTGRARELRWCESLGLFGDWAAFLCSGRDGVRLLHEARRLR